MIEEGSTPRAEASFCLMEGLGLAVLPVSMWQIEVDVTPERAARSRKDQALCSLHSFNDFLPINTYYHKLYKYTTGLLYKRLSYVILVLNNRYAIAV